MERLSKKEKGFADNYLDTGNGTQSALKVYDTQSENTAGAIAFENLRKPKIIAYLESNSEAVASNMVKLALGAKKEEVQVSAGKDVLDRAGFKPVDKSQSIQLQVKGDIKDLTKLDKIKDEYEAKFIEVLNETGE